MQKRMNHFWILSITGLLLLISATACSGPIPATLREAAGLDSDSAAESVPDATTAASDGATAESDAATAESDAVERPAGWSEESHSNDAEPNYEVVFPQDKVNQITITISPEDWAAMQEDMTELFGEPGDEAAGGPGGMMGGGPGGMPGDFAPGAEAPPEGFVPPEGFAPPAGAPPGDNIRRADMTPENPMWAPATIEFDGNTWTDVGVRYKGNSSLTSGWRSGELKLPLKLDFDQFEDDNPAIEDQRFYGFKQLSLANGFTDASFLRDAVTADILAEAGLPAAETAFYEVILDYGEGPVSLGVYTAIEVVDDTVVERIFGSDGGNIYEAEGAAATFAANTIDQIEESFQKENNEDAADYSDIEALFEVLHSEQRTSDPAAWRAQLESIFNVDSFLEWLAISAVIEHWDAYGNMSHNYYLYNNPETGQLEWISWDHNMALSSGGMGGMLRIEREPGDEAGVDVVTGPEGAPADGMPFAQPGGGPGSASVSLDKEEVGEDWPLIRFLLDDPVYYERYLAFLAETIAGPFNPELMVARYHSMAELIAPYAAEDVGQETFEAAVQQLIDHAYERAEEVSLFLESAAQ